MARGIPLNPSRIRREKKFAHWSGLNCGNALAAARSSVSRVRPADFRTCALSLAKGVFDRIEDRTVGRHIVEFGAGAAGFNSLPDARDFVGGQIVHDDEVTSAQGGRQRPARHRRGGILRPLPRPEASTQRNA